MKLRIVPTFENCEIFFTYYFSYVGGYKVALRSSNYCGILLRNQCEIMRGYQFSY